MALRITGKQMDVGDALRSKIDERIGEAVEKYFDGGFSGHVVLERSGSRFTADCMIYLDSGISLQATGHGQEAPAAFDGAAERIEKRLRRYKRKLKSHYPTNASAPTDEISYIVMEGLDDDDEEVAEDYAPTIVAESSLALQTLSVADAVVALDTRDSPVFVFRDGKTGNVNIVYRRPDGNIGWIDPVSVSG